MQFFTFPTFTRISSYDEIVARIRVTARAMGFLRVSYQIEMFCFLLVNSVMRFSCADATPTFFFSAIVCNVGDVAALQKMPLNTVSFFGVICHWVNSAQNIFFWRNSFNMNRIYAMANSAKMVTIKRGRDFTNKQGEKNAMYQISLPVYTNSSIAIIVKTPLPFPARNAFVKVFSRYFDFGKDSLKRFAVNAKTTRIIISHFCYSYLVMILVRLVQCATTVRAVFIIPQKGGTTYA